MSRVARCAVAVAALLVGAAACDSSSGDPAQRERTQRERTQRLTQLGVQPFDTTGRYPLQGVSTLHGVTIPKLERRALGADTLEPAFRTFLERCGACHAPPAPSSQTARLWDATILRMKTNAAAAGLMPWSASDEAAIRRFLEDHASDR